MGQCINFKCHHQNSDQSTHCERCGSELIIDGRLRVIKILSSSSNASLREARTFEAISLKTQEKVILRVVHSDSPSLTTPLLEAVLCLRQVHQLEPNPGIMQLTEEHGYFTWQILPEEPESHFMATQKVEGLALNQWIAEVGVIDEETAADWLRQLVESASALHQEGFIHQDIKPDNIIFGDDDSQPVLVDLGAIRYINPRHSMNPNIRRGAEEYPVIGTPGYQAPEQAEGYPNHTSDYYSIGRTLIHLLSGVHPVDLPISKSGKLLWRDRTQVSAALADLIDRLTEPNQIYRPSTAKDILSYLNDLSEEDNLPTRAERPRRHRRAAKTATFLLLMLGVALAVGVGSALSHLQAQNDANRLFSQGNQLISTGTPNQAVPVLERATEIAPKDADIRATLAFAYVLSGNITTAIDSYGIALELSPDNPFIRYNLANVYEQVDPQQAIANYQIVAQADSPIKEEAINNLARVYILEGELEKADDLLKTSSQDPLIQAVIDKNKGWLRFEQGDFEQSLTFLNKSLELDPTRPDAYCLMAIIKKREIEARDDEITCVSLPTPADRPEVQRWRGLLISRSAQR